MEGELRGLPKYVKTSRFGGEAMRTIRPQIQSIYQASSFAVDVSFVENRYYSTVQHILVP